mgnify:CR=1 FL=1
MLAVCERRAKSSSVELVGVEGVVGFFSISTGVVSSGSLSSSGVSGKVSSVSSFFSSSSFVSFLLSTLPRKIVLLD